jgi:hypothetical protein
MTIRQTAIAKLQQQPESLLLEVSNFIDLVIHKSQSETTNDKPQDDVTKVWKKWFECVDRLPSPNLKQRSPSLLPEKKRSPVSQGIRGTILKT